MEDQAASAAKELAPSPTLDCDLLVVGSGAAGMAAAIRAAAGGLRVLVAEKDDHLGGTSAISGGWLYVPGNKKGSEQFNDSRERIESYLNGLGGKYIDAARVTTFLDTVPEMIDFFERNTAVEFVYPDAAPDYHMEIDGAAEAGRSVYAKPINARLLQKDRMRIRAPLSELTVFGVMPQIGPDLEQFLHANQSLHSFLYVAKRIVRNWAERLVYRRGLDLSNGNALIARMIITAQELGIEMITSAAVNRLTSQDGRATGAILTIGPNEVTVRATRGVVLASGGFSQSAELRQQYFAHAPSADEHQSPVSRFNTGESLRLAAQLGGVINEQVAQPAAWAPVSVFRGIRGNRRVFPHLRGVGLPGIIAVTRQGKRFTNESDSYHDFGAALIKADATEQGLYAFLLCDARTMHRYGLGFAKPWPLPHFPYRYDGYLLTGRTLEELARRAGIDPTNLRATVEEFNVNARLGVDPVFDRGRDPFNWFKGDRSHSPNPSLAPVEKGPFYATQVHLGDLGTFAGLASDPRGRVLDAAGSPIPGLYTAGSASSTVFGGAYPGHGANLGPAMTIGFLIGKTVSE